MHSAPRHQARERDAGQQPKRETYRLWLQYTNSQHAESKALLRDTLVYGTGNRPEN